MKGYRQRNARERYDTERERIRKIASRWHTLGSKLSAFRFCIPATGAKVPAEAALEQARAFARAERDRQ